MYNAEAEKKERRKVVIFAGVTVALILALIVAIVVVATNKSSRKNIGGTDNGSFTISESTENKDDKEQAAKSEDKPASTVGTVTTKPAASTTKPVVTATASDIPNTGPEDMLAVAGILGGVTTAGTAYVMSRKKK